MNLRPASAAAVIVLASCLGACGDDASRDLGEASTAPPTDGTGIVSCTLATDQDPITFSFALAGDYAPDTLEYGEGCLWRRPAPPRTSAPTTDSVVGVEWVGDTESLSDVYDTELPYVDIGGDEEISDLRLAEDVTVFGETVGDRLRWDCFCDGLPTVTYLSQAAGVRLRWDASIELQDQVEDELRVALASAGAG